MPNELRKRTNFTIGAKNNHACVPLTKTLLLVGLNTWTASSMLWPLVFISKFLNSQKLDVLCPGRFVSWTFCILDVW
jgi:hypothetical protein